jgi:hypothetical protein
LDGKKDLATLRQIVGGTVCCASPTIMDINPYDSKQWLVAKILVGVADKVWANDNGMYECSPNMLTIDKSTKIPMFGRIALEVKDKYITDRVREMLTVKKLGL